MSRESDQETISNLPRDRSERENLQGRWLFVVVAAGGVVAVGCCCGWGGASLLQFEPAVAGENPTLLDEADAGLLRA